MVRKPGPPDRPGSSFSRSSVDAPSLTDDLSGSASTGTPDDDGLGYLREAITEYLLELPRQGFSEATANAYGRPLKGFVAFLAVYPTAPNAGSFTARPTCLADITAEHLLAFRDHELSRQRLVRSPQPLSPRTVQHAVKAVRGFFRHLIRRGLILIDPTLDLRGPRLPKTLPRNIPTSRQMKRLLGTPDTSTAIGKRDRAILELLYSTGLRNAELCGLRRGDVDLERRTVFVRHGKGDKERMVPLGKKAVEALTGYLGVYGELLRLQHHQHGEGPDLELPLFLTVYGTRVGAHVLKKQLHKYVKAAKLDPKTTPHSLRHACATHLLKGGADIRQIQSLLGHSSLEATQIYTKVETSDLRAMLDRHHPRGKEDEEE